MSNSRLSDSDGSDARVARDSARDERSHAGRHPVALLDLVETKTSEANHAFATRVTELAHAAGGSRVLANEVLLPLIVSDEEAGKSDRAARLLVITRYPTQQAAQVALAGRQQWEPELSATPVRTYTVRPVRAIESLVQRTLPLALGLLGRKAVPKLDDPRELESLIEAASILGKEPAAGRYEARWTELIERAENRPIWMLNFLEFAPTATYAEDALDAAPSGPISGARAYQRYGTGLLGSLGAVGGRIEWSSHSISQPPGTEDGNWHQLAIAVYPSPAAMMTMLSLPKYRAAHVHRVAGLARTRLLATQPIAGL